MDAMLHERLFTFLAAREGKADSTVQYYLQRLRRIEEEGFSFERFAQGEAEAQAEGDRFIVQMRRQKRSPTAIQNVQKCILALKRFHGYRSASWRLQRVAARDPQIYTFTELSSLLRLPFRRTTARRCERAAIMAHLALGWRISELAKMDETHVDAANRRIHLAHPAKGNPPRWLPVHESFFSPHRAFGSWLRKRPICATRPHAVWTFTDRRGNVRPMSSHRLAEVISDAGRAAGVRANCQRGRSTCLTAHLVQKRDLAFVRFWAGHAGYDVLAAYLAWVDLGMAKHLGLPGWFAQAPLRRKTA